MPRQARIDYPGALHHVIGRAIEKKNIFLREQDKREFASRFEAVLAKSSMHCYAWSIMDNHFHLLLVTGRTKVSRIYEQAFNRVCYILQ